MKYLLDSNVIISLVMNENAGVLTRAAACEAGDMVTSAVAFAEVVYGSLNMLNMAHGALLALGGYICLYVMTVLGLPALAAFLMAMLTVLAMGRRTAKTGAPAWNRIVGAASAGMMISFFLASVTEPHFMMDYSLVLIAMAAAMAYFSAQPNVSPARSMKS